MDTAARGIGLYFYMRRRQEVTLCAIYFLIALLGRFIPDFPFRTAFLVILYAPMAALLLFLSGLFADTDQDLFSTRSSYPFHLLTLPVSTRSLALWPMIYGVVIVPVLWLIFAAVALVPLGWGAYLWWPAAMFAALVAALQAISWSPLPVPYLRLVLSLGSLLGMGALGLIGQQHGWSSVGLCAIYLSLLPACAVTAIRGLRLTRIGAQSEWSGWGEQRAVEAIKPQYLTTPLQAQIWMEWRRNGLVPGIIVLCVNLLLTVLLIANINKSTAWTPLGIHNIEIPTVVSIGVLLSLFATVLAGGSCTPRKIDTLRADMSLQPLLATRPLACVDIIVAKIAASGGMMVIAWAVELFCLIGWLLFPAQQGDHMTTIGAMLFPLVTPGWIGIGVVGLIVLMLQSWFLGVNNLWIELFGQKPLYDIYMAAVAYAAMVLACMGALTVLNIAPVPDNLSQLLQQSPWIPGLIVALCVAKLALSGVVSTKLLRHQLVTTRLLTGVVCVWLVAALVLFLSLKGALPAGQIPPLVLVGGIVLFLPLARLSLSPFTLYINRHR